MPDPITPVKNLTTEDVLYGDRTTSYRWEILSHVNGVDQLVGTLDGVTLDGSLSWVQNAAVKGRGKIRVLDLTEQDTRPGMIRIGDLNLESCRIRPVMSVNPGSHGGHYAKIWKLVAKNRFDNPSFEGTSSIPVDCSRSSDWASEGTHSLFVPTAFGFGHGPFGHTTFGHGPENGGA